jgi:hypothetical protein
VTNSSSLPSTTDSLTFDSQTAPANLLLRAAQETLQQGLELLAATGVLKYKRVLGPPFEASIGQHYRHVLEHYDCLCRGLATDVVNYDARQRDVELETTVSKAIDRTRDLLEWIVFLDPGELERACKSVQSLRYSAMEPLAVRSNIGRELAYCIGHSVHHYAIIRLICATVEVNLPVTFGFAPATLKHKLRKS